MEVSKRGRRRVLSGSPAGFSLLEVLIAGAIFSVGLLALAAMTTVVIKGNDDANRLTVVTGLAEAEIERVTNLTYTQLINTTFTNETVTSTGWTVDRLVTVTPGPEVADMKKIDVKVTWPGANGLTRNLTMTTYRTRPD